MSRRTPKSFTKESISRRVSEEHDLSLTRSRAVVNTMVDAMIDTIESGEKVKLTGLATFTAEPRGARQHRNPKTGEYFKAPPKMVVKVNPSQVLAEKVAELPVDINELD